MQIKINDIYTTADISGNQIVCGMNNPIRHYLKKWDVGNKKKKEYRDFKYIDGEYHGIFFKCVPLIEGENKWVLAFDRRSKEKITMETKMNII